MSELPIGRMLAWLSLAGLLVTAGMRFQALTTAIEENTAKSDTAMRAIMTHHPEFLPDGVVGGRLATEKQ